MVCAVTYHFRKGENKRIRNIVFDMGGVLVEYQPDRVVREFVEDEAERRAVCTSVFVSPEWILSLIHI